MARYALRLVTAAGAGLCFAGAFVLPFPSGDCLLAVAGIAGLLWVLQGVSGAGSRTLGFVWGLAAYGTSLSWFWNLFHAGASALWALLAAFIACFAGFQAFGQRRGLNGWRWVLFTALNWSAWEFIRAELFPLRFPWITPGMAWGPNGLLPWIGVYGVSALIVAGVALILSPGRTPFLGSSLAGLGWLAFFGPPSPGSVTGSPAVRTSMVNHVRSPIPVSVWIVACLGMAGLFWPMKPYTADPILSVRAAAVQNEEVSMDEYLRQTAKLAPDVRLIVWPEYALPYDVRGNKRDMNLLLQVCRGRNAVLTIGTNSRTAPDGTWFNTALTLGPDGLLGEHHKVHPVHFFNDGTPGATSLPIQTPLGKIGTPICFDCDYEGVVRKMTAAGAELIAAPTMDAFGWSELEHWQHRKLFALRACENGRWILVCASSGISHIVDPHGQTHEMLRPMVSGELEGLIQRETALTFYTRFGWLTPWCLLSGAALMTVLLWRRKPQA